MRKCLNCSQQLADDAKFCPACGTRMVEGAALSDSLLGRTLGGKYRILNELGSGSMGTVYLAEHLSLKKKIALKVLHLDLEVSEEVLHRFQREGIAAGKFNHPNAIQIFDFDRSDQQFVYLAMEYVEGKTLKSLIRSKGHLSVAESIDIIRQVLSVLVEAHRHGIVHRDLKPDNIMVMERAGGGYDVKVLDFGLSKLIDRPLGASLMTQAGRIVGTPRYMSPEQCLADDVDHRTDLYAAGLVLYEMLAGESPFHAKNLTEMLRKHLAEPVPSLVETYRGRGIPHELDEIVHHALEKDPNDRYASAAAMLEAIVSFKPGAAPAPARRTGGIARDAARSVSASAAPSTAVPMEKARSRRLVPLALAAAVVAAVGVFAIVSMNSSGTSNATTSSGEEPRYAALLRDAEEKGARGDVPGAMVAVEEALRLEPRNARGYLVRASLHRANGNDEFALADFRDARELEPSSADAVAGIGWIHFDRGEIEAAKEKFAEALQLDASSTESVAGQGAVCYEAGELEEARTLLQKAVTAGPRSSRAQYYLGKVLLDTGKPEAAVDAFVQATRSDSRSSRARAGLAEAYLRAGQLDKAERYFLEALDLNADAAEARTQLISLLLDLEKAADAEKQIEEALARDPRNGRLNILKGIVLHARGNGEEAAAYLEKGIRADGDDPRARTLLGILLQEKGQHEEAIAQYRAAIRLDDSLVEPYLNQGIALFRLERFDEAAAMLEEAVVRDPRNTFAHYSLGILYMDYLGQRERALAEFEKFMAFGGQNERVKGWIESLSR